MCVYSKNGPVDAALCSADGFTHDSLERRRRNLFQGTRGIDLLLDQSNHLLNSSELHAHQFGSGSQK